MLLELNNIKKYFPVRQGGIVKKVNFVRAVDDVSLSIRENEHIGLVGESGSGKTTLGRVILKLLKPDEGNIILEGNDLSKLSGNQMKPFRKRLQMVFQDPYSSLDPRYTIRNVLKEAFHLTSLSSSQQEKKMVDLLNAVGLKADCLNRFPHEFSGGERQRIAIARALGVNPKLLILDEAVSSLDVLVQLQIIQLLRQLQKEFNVTYFFISHNLRVIKRLCPKLAVMYRGKIVEYGDSAKIFNKPAHPYTQQLLAAAVNYQPAGRAQEIFLPNHSRMVEIDTGHFVLEE